jgi:hypothetical protein
MTLIEMLSKAEDKRSRFGLRHELTDVMLMCIMAIMSGYYGYREIGRFLKNHSKEFQQTFRLLHKVPSHVTIRAVLQGLDFESFCNAFNEWAGQYVQMGKDHTNAIDGKAIASTIVNYDNSYQNFISLVSIFSVQRGIVLRCEKIENKKQSEIPTVRKLIEALDVKSEIFTIDALHCQKKRQK